MKLSKFSSTQIYTFSIYPILCPEYTICNKYVLQFLQHATAPFEPGARKLLILSYRAADGTLLGELVDNSPNAMHVTEILDGVYTAMYGSRDFIVPEDILNNKDGTLRYDMLERFSLQNISTESEIRCCNMASTKCQIMIDMLFQGYG